MIESGVDQAAVVAKVKGCWDEWKEARRKKEDTWRDCTNAYLTTIDEANYEEWPWRCKVADTFVQETGDTIASALKNSLFPITDRYFRVVGTDDIGIIFQDMMQADMERKLLASGFTERIMPYLKQLTILGNAPYATPWITETRQKAKRKRRVDADGNVIHGKETYEEVTFDSFSFETLDAFDVVFDPSKIHASESPVIRKVYRTDEQLKNMGDLYSNLDQLESQGSSGDEDEGEKRQRAQVFGLDYEPARDCNEIKEWHGDITIDGETFPDYLVVTANDNTLLRFEPNPFWGGKPVGWGTYDPMWFTAYGKGPIEPILGTYDLINTFTNQKSDVLNLIINGAFAYVDDGIIDPENLRLRPGGALEVGNLANIKALQPNTNVALAFNEIAELRQRGERSSGASTFSKGAVPVGKRTAFEVNAIQQGSGSRFNDITKHQGDSVIERILNFYLESIKQFKFGSGDMPDHAYLGEYRVEFLGAELSAVKSFETQQLLNMTDIFSRHPELTRALNPTELANEFRRLFGIKNDKLVRSEEEIAQLVAQEQAAQAQQAGASGGTPGPGNVENPDAAMLQAAGLVG